MIVQILCPICGGSGIEGEVTHEMAVDACEPTLEGQLIHCHICKGDGFILEEVEEEK